MVVTLTHHVNAAAQHDVPCIHVFVADVLQRVVCNRQVAVLLRQFLWHLCAACIRI
jgi:hypothetical protein